MDGTPFRKLADQHKITGFTAYHRVSRELNSLPDNTWLTKEFCSRYCGILIVDGKYVKVRGYPEKIPFIYGIDYLTHDIPVGLLAPSENEEAFSRLFRLLKECGYPLQIVVSGDRYPLKTALLRHYPKAINQLCQGHYLENIRRTLTIRTEEKHRSFFGALRWSVFKTNHDLESLNDALFGLYGEYAIGNEVYQSILVDIEKRTPQLFAYWQIPHCPRDTNLIELYNSHFQGRLKSIKGFKSFKSAQQWLNAAMIRRRTKELTDCQGYFKSLNGRCSIEIVLKKEKKFDEVQKLLQRKAPRI